MKNHDEKYLEFIMHDKNLLLLSDNAFAEHDDIFSSFNTFVINKISKDTIENTDAILLQERPDIVILNSSEDKDFILNIIHEIYQFDDNITIVLILDSSNTENQFDAINKVDFVLSNPFTNEDLLKKMYASLNENSIIKTTIKGEKDKTEDVEVFLDTFEGEILFLNEELKDYITQFDNGELSHELLSEVAEKMKEVSVVFSRHSYTKRVSPIFTQLASYLDLLNIQKVSVENIEGFIFLARIIDDIQNYLFEYFVSRIFVDVYVFEDSLKNSIKFMQDRLETADTSHDHSELNFF